MYAEFLFRQKSVFSKMNIFFKKSRENQKFHMEIPYEIFDFPDFFENVSILEKTLFC